MAGKKITLLRIDPARAQREIEDFLIRKITGAGASGGVVGLSGGIDSSTVAYLAAFAFRRRNKENPSAGKLALVGLIMPSDANDPQDEKDAADIAARLEIEHRVVRIQPIIDLFTRTFSDVLNTRHHLGNLASEIRAVILSRHAAGLRCLVLGTGNRDEDYNLGYFTKRGDGAVDLSPLGALSKRSVRILASHLGVPQGIIGKTPSAGLWKGQTDEGELGFSYEFAELVMAGYAQGLLPDEIASQAKCRAGDVERVLSVHNANKHKMSPPEIAPVTFLNNPPRTSAE